MGGKYLYLGSFHAEADAAAAFDRQAYAVRLERAKLNFPHNKARPCAATLASPPALALLLLH